MMVRITTLKGIKYIYCHYHPLQLSQILESMKEPCNRVFPAAIEVSRISMTLVWPLSKCNHTTTTATLPNLLKDPDITNQTI